MTEEKETNRLGLTVEDYTCTCGHINLSVFLQNRKPKKCYRCHKPYPFKAEKP